MHCNGGADVARDTLKAVANPEITALLHFDDQVLFVMNGPPVPPPIGIELRGIPCLLLMFLLLLSKLLWRGRIKSKMGVAPLLNSMPEVPRSGEFPTTGSVRKLFICPRAAEG